MEILFEAWKDTKDGAHEAKQLATLVEDVFHLIPSGKRRDLGYLEPMASLKYRIAG